MNGIDLAETGFVPDAIIRLGIRRLLAERIRSSSESTVAFAERLRNSPLAVATEEANQQHYEVPTAFFQHALGPRLKYSSCYFASEHSTLADAEEEMLRQTCEHAQLANGMRVLELGCGWGSLTLWMAQHYPASEITAVSNSRSQRAYIERRAEELGLTSIRVITADMRTFSLDETFNRVISVEMFEHMRNYQTLFERVANWLSDEGKALVHVFCHCENPYFFESEGCSNWMGKHFFTGGLMPSEDLFSHFDEDIRIAQQWRINGLHYSKTCEAWLANLDRNRAKVLRRLGQEMSSSEAKRNVQRWRIFFMACSELFKYEQGDRWLVAHYLFEPTRVGAITAVRG